MKMEAGRRKARLPHWCRTRAAGVFMVLAGACVWLMTVAMLSGQLRAQLAADGSHAAAACAAGGDCGAAAPSSTPAQAAEAAVSLARPPPPPPPPGGFGRVSSRVLPLDERHGFFEHDGFRVSLRNVALFDNSIHVYNLSAAHRSRAEKTAPIKQSAMNGHQFTSPNFTFVDGSLDLAWCRGAGQVVDETSHTLALWLPTNFFHIVADNSVGALYSILTADPRIAAAGLRRPSAPGAIDAEMSPTLLSIIEQPRRVYELLAHNAHSVPYWRDHENGFMAHLLGLFHARGEADKRSLDDALSSPRPTCFRHLRWVPNYRPMALYYHTFDTRWDGVLYALARYSMRERGLSVRAAGPDERRPGVAFLTRSCSGNGRCVQSRDRLASAFRERHGVAMELITDYGDMRGVMEAVSQRADVLVGMHGAGLANAAFLRPGSVLVELKPSKGYRSLLYRYMAYHVGAYYFEWDVWGGLPAEPHPDRAWALTPTPGGLGNDAEPTVRQAAELVDAIMRFWAVRHERKARFMQTKRRHEDRLWPHCQNASLVECPPLPPGYTPEWWQKNTDA